MASQASERKLSFVLNEGENKENAILIWFDPSTQSHDDTEKVKQQLRLINDRLSFPYDFDECLRRIESITEEKILLITSGTKASQILPQIHSYNQIDSIFIFGPEKDLHESLLNQYQKLIGIYFRFDDLSKAIKDQIDLINKQIDSFYFFDQDEVLLKELSQESAKFLWAQLFHSLVNYLPRNQHAKRQIIHLCKEYYNGNSKEVALINEFEQHYQPQDALRWYAKESFVKKLINKAFAVQDINFLYYFRFFLVDLNENLQQQNQRDKLLSSNEHILNVYRGVKLNKEEFDKIKQNHKKLLSCDGYLLTFRQKFRAIEFLKKPTKRTDLIPVLFHIQCDIKSLDKHLNYGELCNKNEILFDFNACFEIESIEEHDSLQIITMNLSNKGQQITNDYIQLKQKQTEKMNIPVIFGRLLCNLKEYDKARRFFQQFFNDSNDDDRAWVEFNIGRVLGLKKDWSESRKYFDHAYDRMMNTKPPRTIDSAHVLNSIGCLLANQGKYDEAFDFHQRALEIREKFYPSDHIDIAQSLYNIAIILDQQGKYDDSLDYYQTALKIQKQHYPSIHPHIYRSLNDIGIILYRQGKYQEALDYHQQALKIEEILYPSGHADLAYTLNNIGIILRNKGNQNEALAYCQRALKIEEKIYPSGHANIAKSLGNIGNILSDQEKYEQALIYHQRALSIEEKYYPQGNTDIGHNLNHIGICYENLNNEDMALQYYQRALAIYEKFLPRDHPRRQRTEHNIQRLTEEN